MYEFDHAQPVTLVVRAQGGLVEITAEERDTVQVDVQPMDTSDAAQEAARNTRVELDDGTLLVQAPGSEHWLWRRTPKLLITARVPIGSALHAKSAAADVRAAGVFSTAHVNVASADVQVAEVIGDAYFDAASGDIAVGRVGGGLRIKSSSGALHIGDVTGDVNASTASGHIRAGRLESSVKAGTASGDIEIARLRQGKASVKTASGDVQVGVAPGSGVWMDLNTASGRSSSDLTAAGDTPPAGDPVSLELRIRTASGNIHVHRATESAKAA
ncbi:DUF4097 and DUF4098 domain-containing protein YvlB [Actinoplanes tereljensis]|uniref:DUF4097 domain-containing protein n=1 Tax=Paractinoplanes tereljensis TaxID=571912 RepID=A0A919TXE9_9ACTN|nr:DUF4097 family beta strand repeat-containing protein [Actinoplanes tereljensis]GIF26211.1 hypothetical protein Ate02nite_89410 [Actinoplanes tereljensis]